MTTRLDTDVAIIGGGPAGLQAAQTLSRVHRRAVLFDDGHYRNATVAHMHNIAGHDGRPPAEFRATARAELASYDTIEIRDLRVEEVTDIGEGFVLRAADGSELTARALVLATGVRDELPAIDGLQELWGDLAAQCPFCHAHEFAGRRIGTIGAATAAHAAAMLGPIAGEVVAFAHGEEVPTDFPSTLALRTEKITSVARHAGGVRVHLADGGHEDVAALFVTPTLHQSAPFAAQLGLDLNPSGAIRIDEFGRTSRPGVLAAGDLAHLPAYPMPMASVVNAMAAGQMAASGAVMSLLTG